MENGCIAGGFNHTGRPGATAYILDRMDRRAQIILKTLVERYIADGEPVGSRVLSRQSGLELSPATVRNVMADLEEMGFITSPEDESNLTDPDKREALMDSVGEAIEGYFAENVKVAAQ